MARRGWNPWRALRALPHVIFELHPVGRLGGGAVWGHDDDGDVIAIDPGLSQLARKAALAHELVHVERGIGYGDTPPLVMQHEEALVRRVVVDRLVPAVELDSFIDETVDRDGYVTALQVAEEFEVPEEIATTALVRARARRLL